MIVLKTIAEARAFREVEQGPSWGLVPTMGYLHAGHLSLVELAKNENDRTAVSIYVNPTQFSPNEDLDSYPRDLQRDLSLLEAAGVDMVFIPDDGIMYPNGFQTNVIVSEMTKFLEGASRPTHFQGVTTIVIKLFNIIQPTRAYFGQKDAQQTIVIRQMVRDLNIPVEIIIGPTVREPDGLALSSRNKYLDPAQRAAATVLIRSLTQAKETYMAGIRDGQILRERMIGIINAEPLARVDYVSAADPATLVELDDITNGVLFSMAVFFGRTRLIDNLLIEPD